MYDEQASTMLQSVEVTMPPATVTIRSSKWSVSFIGPGGRTPVVLRFYSTATKK